MRRAALVATMMAGALSVAAPALAQTPDYLKAAAACMGFDKTVTGPAALAACKTALGDAKLSASDKSDLYVGQGYQLALAGKYDDSVASYDQALVVDGANIDARFGRAEVLIAQLKPAAALVDLDILIKNDPNDADLLSRRGGVYLYFMDDSDKAIADYTKALALEKTPADLLSLGEALTNKGELAKGLASMDEAIKLKPDFMDAFGSRCYTRMLIGADKAGALADCDKAIAMGMPVGDSTGFFRGVLLYQMGKYADAWTAFDKVAKAIPDDPESRYGRGLAGVKLNRAGAIDDITAALKEDADIPDYFVDYGIKDRVNADGTR